MPCQGSSVSLKIPTQCLSVSPSLTLIWWPWEWVDALCNDFLLLAALLFKKAFVIKVNLVFFFFFNVMAKPKRDPRLIVRRVFVASSLAEEKYLLCGFRFNKFSTFTTRSGVAPSSEKTWNLATWTQTNWRTCIHRVTLFLACWMVGLGHRIRIKQRGRWMSTGWVEF